MFRSTQYSGLRLIIVFAGLEANPGFVFDEDDTSRFFFVDGAEEGLEFFAEPGQTPWESAQPNNFGGNDDCVLYAHTPNFARGCLFEPSVCV